ncbi:MAG: peroxiredoxin [Candidatus Poseidoniaceae archaeon]|jgi:peroxiredoxin Q/BCP|tara:strand:+ start:496 stop:975 length:480 start_codon:yes stop_codon:yes gene_type:complete
MTNQLAGEKAPDFTLPSSKEESVSLSDYDGKWKVVFFYAKDGSPTCKRGCLTFKEQFELFQSLTPSVEVIGISQDSIEDHRRFKEELELPFALLSDPDRKVAEAFGVPMFLGRFPAKSSFLIGPDRTVHYCYDWLFRPRRHVARILDAFSELSSGGSMK